LSQSGDLLEAFLVEEPFQAAIMAYLGVLVEEAYLEGTTSSSQVTVRGLPNFAINCGVAASAAIQTPL